MSLEAGTLNRRITIQMRSVTQDPLGGEIVTWNQLATVWGNVRYLNGVETLKANAVTATAKASIRIRWRDDVLPTCRVVYGATVFDVLAVLPDESGHEHVDLVCETGANNG